MSLANPNLLAIGAAAAIACAPFAGAQAGGLASLCAEYESRSVAGIIEDLLTEVDDCVRIAVAPADSPRPEPRPVLLAAPAAPIALPATEIVTAALGSPVLLGGTSESGLIPNGGGGGGGGGWWRRFLDRAPVVHGRRFLGRRFARSGPVGHALGVPRWRHGERARADARTASDSPACRLLAPEPRARERGRAPGRAVAAAVPRVA